MSYHLFLDDQRNPKDVFWVKLPENVAWVIARNYEQFVRTVESRGVPGFVSFDIDLHEEHYAYANTFEWLMMWAKGKFKHKTGADCASWLSDYCKRLGKPMPEFEVHSMNGTAKNYVLQHHKHTPIGQKDT